MKNKIIQLGLLIVVLFLGSCYSPVGFTKAQPQNGSDLNEIPQEYQGIFICDTDSVLIKVEKNLIYSEVTQMAITPMSYIRTREDCSIINDSLYINGRQECRIIEQQKEGYVGTVKVMKDTLFIISPVSKVREYKGQLIMSNYTENKLWAISVLQLDGTRGVQYRAITDKSNLQALESITPMEKLDSRDIGHLPKYKISPKSVEFDQLLESPEVFVDCEYYIRINLIE